MSARHITLVLSISFSSLINLPTYPPPSATTFPHPTAFNKAERKQLHASYTISVAFARLEYFM
jgi:hypothetical protein